MLTGSHRVWGMNMSCRTKMHGQLSSQAGGRATIQERETADDRVSGESSSSGRRLPIIFMDLVISECPFLAKAVVQIRHAILQSIQKTLARCDSRT